MIAVWKCAVCFHANKGRDNDVCYWCGASERKAIFPVTVPNQLQGTPSYEELNDEITHDEANRHTEIPFEDQLRELIAKLNEEIGKWRS